MSVLAHTWVGPTQARQVAVVLHGIMGSARNWRTPAKKLADRHPGLGVLSLDHPGHGTSPAAREATMFDCADLVEATLSRLGCEADVVIGHSFGGKVTSLETVLSIAGCPRADTQQTGTRSSPSKGALQTEHSERYSRRLGLLTPRLAQSHHRPGLTTTTSRTSSRLNQLLKTRWIV